MKSRMYVVFALYVLPTLLVSAATRASTKVCSSVLGWLLLVFFNLYFGQLVLTLGIVYLWINGNSIMRLALMFNEIHSSRLGLWLVVSVHGFFFSFVVATVKSM